MGWRGRGSGAVDLCLQGRTWKPEQGGEAGEERGRTPELRGPLQQLLRTQTLEAWGLLGPQVLCSSGLVVHVHYLACCKPQLHNRHKHTGFQPPVPS
jgi:hypothetical protein